MSNDNNQGRPNKFGKLPSASNINGPAAARKSLTPHQQQLLLQQQQQQLQLQPNSIQVPPTLLNSTSQSLTPSNATNSGVAKGLVPGMSQVVSNPNAVATPNQQLRDPTDVLCPTLRRMGYAAHSTDVVGEGAFSKVYRATSNQIPNKAIAVKIVRLDDPNIPQAWKDHSMKRELKILKRVKHPNVITIYDVIKTRSRIFIFMDLAAASISSHLEATEEPASEQTARNWFGGISNAIAYLHSLELAHRDLKNDNILIDGNGNAKLTDFGFACFTFDRVTRTEILSNTSCGTKAYVAPEVFSPPYNAKAADVWSLGICLFECVTLMQPFRDDLPLPVFIRRQVERGLVIPSKFQESMSPLLQDLLKRMVEPDVQRRVRSEGIIVHPWVRIIRRA